MRIFLGVQQSPVRHPVPAYGFWEHYLVSALREAGHETLATPDIDWARGLLPLAPPERAAWLDHTWSRTLDYLRAEHARSPVDLALFYLFPDQADASALAALRALGVPTVNFFCDNVREFRAVPESFRGFDLHWVPEHAALRLYDRAGLPRIHAPMPMWVPASLRTPPARETNDITFVGSHDLLREDLLGQAVRRGLPLRLHGAGWTNSTTTPPPAAPAAKRRTLDTFTNQIAFLRRHGPGGFLNRATYQFRPHHNPGWIARHWRPLADDDYASVTRESRVVLGINRYPGFHHTFTKPGRYSRLRDIEAPMLGACYLTENAPGLDQLYDLENEILAYRNIDELLHQTDRLTRDAGLRSRLRQAGQRRALAEHSIPRTIDRICRHLGLHRS